MLSRGRTRISNPLICEDTLATLGACLVLGAGVENDGNDLVVQGIHDDPTGPGTEAEAGAGEAELSIDCSESGTTLRFMMAVAPVFRERVVLKGRGKLPERPIAPLSVALGSMGVSCQMVDGEGVRLRGRLQGGVATVDASISSQFVSALLLALPSAPLDSELTIAEPSSKPYIKMTAEMAARFGISLDFKGDGRVIIAGKQVPRPPLPDCSSGSHLHESCNDAGKCNCGCGSIPGGENMEHDARPRVRADGEIRIEGDYSSASFLLAAGALCGDVAVTGLDHGSSQGDRAIVGLLSQMGADIVEIEGGYRAGKSPLNGTCWDCSDTPDLFPVAAVLCAFASGQESRLTGTARLAYKESNRIEAVRALLESMGARVGIERGGDEVVIVAPGSVRGFSASSRGDHRIAMAAVVAALASGGECAIDGTEAVAKSYPSFIHDIAALGAASSRMQARARVKRVHPAI